jgi:dipeptidyl aminopeptidase/acylaminoacyl peptidase
MSRIAWRKDSRAFTFEYNQRGHQVYRVIEVDASNGAPRALVDENASTFFCYYSKRFVHHVDDGRELIWMSERDGWNHLYLYDGATGQVKHQITRGEWVVRSVAKVDDEKRQIWFAASGMHPGKDPYFLHWFRINFDGTGLTPLTQNPDVNHSLAFTADMSAFIDTYSNPQTPTVSELRRTRDQSLIATLENGGPARTPVPETFVARARDGKTDIWGLIYRPSNFNAAKKYPVLEYIYAGPHDSFVPKTFQPAHQMQAMAELGFIVVQMDGMGTSNRSKAFHDVCWKNIRDAGFPDRILWHKAAAAKYNWYDVSRVGIYGHSAGGQSSLGALLFHGDFYKAAASSAGCHDNRMDKISWNEQWMGWPVGPEYIASSNVEHAHQLRGRLLLAVGELDTNVDPASTMQVVNALIKANKTFDLLFLPGRNHGGWGDYYDRKRSDFFVRELLGVQPPDWNKAP